MKDKKKLSIEAKISNLDKVTDFVRAKLEEKGCTSGQIMQCCLAAEEIFVNIAHYAYGELDPMGNIISDSGMGQAEIIVDADDSRITLTFIDEGTEYNPLEKDDPDIAVPIKDREIGGLGIYMVKKLMDEMNYRYEDGKNILSVMKITQTRL
ncbi:MAG: ATP-binding protein [Butyrivibrio sp.]|nr:ATP-binding protein [Butyrivibrio sp.]